MLSGTLVSKRVILNLFFLSTFALLFYYGTWKTASKRLTTNKLGKAMYKLQATEQYFRVVLFIMLYNVILTLSLWKKS